MQTFYPYTEPLLTAHALDNKRLGKQRVEGKQILDLLEGRRQNNWRNHPAVRMWEGHANYLKFYVNIMILEWIRRGKVNNMPLYAIPGGQVTQPEWTTDLRMLYSHRANLIQKDVDHYGPMWPEIDDSRTPYWWPVPLKTKKKQEEIEAYWNPRGNLLESDGLIIKFREEI